jgi:hypothetical protein
MAMDGMVIHHPSPVCPGSLAKLPDLAAQTVTGVKLHFFDVHG